MGTNATKESIKQQVIHWSYLDIPIHIKMIPLKHSYMCIKSLPDEAKN